FTFPALPLACIAWWKNRREAEAALPIQFCVLASAVLMGVLAISASARESYALPLLVPLSILAAPAASTLPARIDKWWTVGALVLFGSLAAAAWAVWIAVMLGTDAAHTLSRALPLDFSRSPVHGVSLAWAAA